MPNPTFTKLTFCDLKGWPDDDHQAAFDVFAQTCSDIDDPHWSVLSDFIETKPDPRQFFEAFFCPVLIEDGTPGHFTGYYEPELSGVRKADAKFAFPIYAAPEELVEGTVYYTRREIEQENALEGRKLELVWLSDPVDVFFLQVQGSGRISFSDGSVMRVGFAAKNGHPYTSIGAKLVEWGELTDDEVSPKTIRDWVHRRGDEGQELLWKNQSFVFFQEINDLPAESGPLGALGCSITEGRSLAVDPEFVQLGAPVWIEKEGDTPMQRLMIAQDIGSAIKGAQRADLFAGTGPEAGAVAGMLNDPGRMVVLMPKTKIVDIFGDDT